MSRLLAVVAAGSLAIACSDQGTPADASRLDAFGDSEAALKSDRASGGNFGTPLKASEEVMPSGVVNSSKATGNATFRLSEDGTSLEYRLIVANIRNVTMAHIHAAPAGSNGGVVAWLHPSTSPGPDQPGGGRVSGVIAQGTLTAADLMGSLAGGTLADLVALIRAGGTYVNVHTDDGTDPPNTGPGDYPGGEVRGQIEHRGH